MDIGYEIMLIYKIFRNCNRGKLTPPPPNLVREILWKVQFGENVVLQCICIERSVWHEIYMVCRGHQETCFCEKICEKYWLPWQQEGFIRNFLTGDKSRTVGHMFKLLICVDRSFKG